MIIYVEEPNKKNKYIEIYFQNNFDKAIFTEYDESIIYPDCLMLEYFIDEKNRDFNLIYSDLPISLTNQKINYYFCMQLSPKSSLKNYEILKSLPTIKFQEANYNLNRCGIFLHSELFFSFSINCNGQKLKDGLRGLNYIEYLKNRFIQTLEFILNLYHVK